MKTENRTLLQGLRQILYAGLITAAGMPPAPAADTDQNSNPTPATPPPPGSTGILGKIEVTGSRIKRSDRETAQPVTIITAAQIRATGLISIGDVLQQLSSAGAALNTQFNNGGNGNTYVDLRNLGPKRLLVLVNGRRWIDDIGGAVDTNTIPVSIVDHVEVLQDGASAIYGSDAIAGVINIITVKDYNGAQANAYLGTYDAEGHHDGKQQEYDFTLGSSGDKGGVVMNVSYVNQDPVWAGNRAISREPVIGSGLAGGSGGTPSGRFIIAPVASGGACPNGAFNTFTSGSCDLTLVTPGQKGFANQPGGPSLGNFRNGNFGSNFNVGGVATRAGFSDNFNFAPANYLLTPSERTGLFVQGHYGLADNLEFDTEVLFNRRDSQEVLAPSPLAIGAFGSLANGEPIGIAASNPYNPFGVNLTANLSDPCLATGTCDLLTLSERRLQEAGNRIFQQSRDTYSFRGSLKGYFDADGGEWDWNVNYAYGNNYNSNLTSGLVNTERLQLALGPSATNPQTGAPGCLQNGEFLPGCVPVNWFGGAPSLTPAMLQYLMFEGHDISSSTLRNYTANVTGDLANLPAGPLSLAAGYEYLENDGYFHADALSEEGNTSNIPAPPTDGAERSDAEYVEFDIPLLADAPYAKRLDLDIANRWSQFRWNGGETGEATGVVHATATATGRAALRWQTTDSLLLRGSWSQGFRVPSISELFTGDSDSFVGLVDPCVISASNPTAAPNCGSLPHNQRDPSIRTTVGGSAALNPEKSISETAGFVYEPPFLPGFDISADYFKINVTDAISVIPPQTILAGCYGQGTGGVNNAYCQLVQRGSGNAFAAGAITDILDVNVNIGGILTEGVDVQAGYKFPSTTVGDFKTSLTWTFTREYVVTIPFGPDGALSSEDLAGETTAGAGLAGTSTVTGGVPKQRANVDFGWNAGEWSAAWHVEFIGALIEDCQAAPLITPSSRCPLSGNFPYAGGTVPENHIGGTFYHDAYGTYHVDRWNTDFTLGVRNLFDKEPPIAMSAFGNSFLPTYYRVPGRFFYARVGVKF